MSSLLPPPGTERWDFPRSAVGLRHLLDYARRAGLDPAPLLIGTGLAVEELEQPEVSVVPCVVTAAQELGVVRALARRLPESGAEVGRRYTADSFGVMGWAMQASENLGAAVEVALRFIDLSFAFVIPVARLEGARVVADLDAGALPADVRGWLLARDACAIATVLESLVPGGVGLELVLDGDLATLSFPAVELDRPLVRDRHRDREAAEVACSTIAAERRAREGLTADVRVLVVQRLREGAPMPRVAAALGMSERSLRRRLAAEGTSYRVLLEDVRSALAGQLLGVGLPVADVAARLGYAETAALTHAHHRWTGRPPRGTRTH